MYEQMYLVKETSYKVHLVLDLIPGFDFLSFKSSAKVKGQNRNFQLWYKLWGEPLSCTIGLGGTCFARFPKFDH